MDQLQLNKSLYDECTKDNFSIEKIKELLDAGANPLGLMPGNDIVYVEIIYDALDKKTNSDDLINITKVFLEKGMKIDSKLFPEENDDLINPLWELAFLTNRTGIEVLKLLLEAKTDVKSIEELIDHIYTDEIFLNSFDCVHKYSWQGFEYGIKMIMLCSSYSYMLDESEYLRNLIEIDHNDKNFINSFNTYDDYYVELFLKENNKIDIRLVTDDEIKEPFWEMNDLK